MTEKYPKRIILYFYRMDEFDDSPGNKNKYLGGVFLWIRHIFTRFLGKVDTWHNSFFLNLMCGIHMWINYFSRVIGYVCKYLKLVYYRFLCLIFPIFVYKKNHVILFFREVDGLVSPDGMMDMTISRYTSPPSSFANANKLAYDYNTAVAANSSCSRNIDAYSPASHLASSSSAMAAHPEFYRTAAAFQNLASISVKSEFWPHSYGHPHSYAASNYNMSPIQS